MKLLFELQDRKTLYYHIIVIIIIIIIIIIIFFYPRYQGSRGIWKIIIIIIINV